jgi:hypothetical protein
MRGLKPKASGAHDDIQPEGGVRLPYGRLENERIRSRLLLRQRSPDSGKRDPGSALHRIRN